MFLLKLYSGYYILYGLFWVLRRMGILYQPKKFPILYIKEIPFHLNQKSIHKLRLLAQFICTVSVTAIIAFVIINNLLPFGEEVQYQMGHTTDDISPLGPKGRVSTKVQNGEKIFYQSHDLLYFSTKMPFPFDTATVKFIFQNNDPDQTVSVGFEEGKKNHYNTQLIDAPILNDLSWSQLTNKSGKILYQRDKHFLSIDDFLSHLPTTALIGTYNYDPTIGPVRDVTISDYKPSSQPTVIETPLRGKHVLFVYLKNEPFTMKILKQDLNWYEGPDDMSVKIYKNNILVDEVVADDDGIQDASKKVLPPQEISIKNPSKQLPENGVYKVVIDANNDTIIKKITTNLHKIVFQGSIFLAGNHESYPTVVASNAATTVYTNALTLSAITYHSSGEQIVAVDNQTVPLAVVNQSQIFIPHNNFSQVVLPKNDIVLSGYWGYFAFDQNQFFLPNPYRVMPLQSREDLNIVDYVFANYIPPKKIGDWKVAQYVYNLNAAYIKNNKLNWVIKAPNLKDNNRQIFIKDIVITFNKKPWL